jgi:hypothetical protein
MAKRDEKKDIRNFALALAGILAVLAGIAYWKGRMTWPYLGGGAVLIAALGLFAKPLLRPIFRGWMWLANKLNWAMTRVILTLAWLILFAPIGLLLRLFRVDFFDRKWDPAAPTYWRARPDKPYDRRQTEKLG